MLEFVTSADGSRIAVDRSGQGRQLVIIHGSGSDRNSVTQLASFLAGDFEVLAYDRRGRGDSGDGSVYAMAREVEDLLAVAGLCRSPPSAFGISYGGLVLLDALASGIHLKGAAMFEPPLQVEPDPEKAALTSELVDLSVNGNWEKAVERQLTALHGLGAGAIEEMKSEAGWRIRVSNAVVSMREMHMVHAEYSLDLDRMQEPPCPVHLLEGSETMPFIKQSCAAIARLPFVRHHLLPGLDHGAAREAPQAVADILKDVLK